MTVEEGLKIEVGNLTAELNYAKVERDSAWGEIRRIRAEKDKMQSAVLTIAAREIVIGDANMVKLMSELRTAVS